MPDVPLDSPARRTSHRTSRRTAIAGSVAGLAALSLERAVIQDATPTPFRGETFVGETSDPAVFVAIVVAASGSGAQEARAYLCDSATISEWLRKGTASDTALERREVAIPAEADAGADMLLELRDDAPGCRQPALGRSGTALLPRDGVYPAAPMTYISPSNTQTWDQWQVRGDTYELHVHGNVYGLDNLADSIEGAISRRRAYGLRQ